jgi:hypothetical protein
MDSKEEMPAWMMCQEILVKAKNELILEAVDALHREVAAKRMEVNGDIVRIEGKDNDVDKDLFVINNLMQQEPQIREQYGEYIAKAERGAISDPSTLERVEELKKFLMSLSEIHLLMKFARVFDQWVLDFEGTADLKNPDEMIAATAKRNADRIDALEFVLKNRTFIKNEALSEAEFKVFSTAFRMCR